MLKTITEEKQVEVCDLCGSDLRTRIHMDDKYYCSDSCYHFDKYKTVEKYLEMQTTTN